jgi:hypothetical protein
MRDPVDGFDRAVARRRSLTLVWARFGMSD